MSFETETYVQLEQIIRTITPPKKIKSSDYLESGKYPIIDQSPGEIAGWTNEESALVHPPTEGLIVFGDHTCVLKYMAEPFAQGADGIKILRPDESVNAYYIFAHLKAFPLPNDGYKRHFSDLKRLEIKVPEKRIQDYISELAFLFNSKINVNMALSKTLESIAQSIFKSWFIDFDPVHAKSRGEKPFGMDEETAALFPDSFEESELGMIPKGWNVGRISQLCRTISNGSTPRRLNERYWKNGEVDWYKTGELSDKYLLSSDELITTDAVNETSVKLLPAGSILMAIYASPTVGRLGILTKPSTFNQACTGLIPNDQIGTCYLYMNLFFNRDYFNSMASGAAQQNISKAIVENCPVTQPNQDTINAFRKLCDLQFQELLTISLQSRALETLRDALLPRLISGELQIPEDLLVS